MAWVAGILILGVVVYAGVFVLTFKRGLGQIMEELGENQGDNLSRQAR
jgi:hypothetical protein